MIPTAHTRATLRALDELERPFRERVEQLDMLWGMGPCGNCGFPMRWHNLKIKGQCAVTNPRWNGLVVLNSDGPGPTT